MPTGRTKLRDADRAEEAGNISITVPVKAMASNQGGMGIGGMQDNQCGMSNMDMK
jgi:hypothetical protein